MPITIIPLTANSATLKLPVCSAMTPAMMGERIFCTTGENIWSNIGEKIALNLANGSGH